MTHGGKHLLTVCSACANLGSMLRCSSASQSCDSNTNCQGASSIFALPSLACHAVNALVSLCRMVGYTPASSAARYGNQGCSQACIGCVSLVGSHASTAAAMRGRIRPCSTCCAAPRGSNGRQRSNQVSRGSGCLGSQWLMAVLQSQNHH